MGAGRGVFWVKFCSRGVGRGGNRGAAGGGRRKTYRVSEDSACWCALSGVRKRGKNISMKDGIGGIGGGGSWGKRERVGLQKYKVRRVK